MVALATVKAIEAQQEEIEQKYIAEKGIINTNGSAPKFTCCIDDKEAADKAIEEVSELIVTAGLEDTLNAARTVLKVAEDNVF